ncbi:MAG: outer membrane protein assembly factor BamA [Candidatus Kapabacteria bacterium]|nr:outer membrane protein assembly factor BamA [Candidatus Kapabacteria bacterium]
MRVKIKSYNSFFVFLIIFSIIGISHNKLKAQQEQETFRISGVTVEGNRLVDAETIVALSGLRSGDELQIPFDQKINTAIRNLWKRKQFSDIDIVIDRISSGGIFLTLKVKEFPKLSEMKVIGNNAITEKKIKESSDKVRGEVISDFDQYTIKRKIKKLYDDEGLLFAQVEPIILGKDSTYCTLLLKIDEGKAYKVAKISFEGNKYFTEKQLASSFDNTAEKTWWKFWKSFKFDKKEYEKDRDLLKKYFRKNGFIDGEITSTISNEIQFDSVNEVVYIKIKVNEGDKIYLRKVEFKGNTVYKDEQFLKRLDFKKGDVFDLEKFENNLRHNEDQSDISSIYLDNGYLSANLEKEETRISKDSIDVIIRVFEGDRVTIRRVDIVGNTKTKDKVIRRELYTRPGDFFDKSAIMRSLRGLGVLNYFSPESLRPDVKPVPRDNTQVDIVYKVDEHSTDTFNAQIGYAGTYGFTGSFGITLNNFSFSEPLYGGGGQVFNFTWEKGVYNNMQTFSLGLSEPWFLDEPTTTGFNLFDSKINMTNYNYHRTGASVNLGRRFRWPDDYFRGDVRLTVQKNDIGSGTASAYYKSGSERSVHMSISRISLDNLFFPKSGSRFSLSSTIAPGALGGLIFGNVDYFKNEMQLDMYNPLLQINGNDRLILFLGSKLGYVTGFKHDSTISPIDYYYMGGSGIGYIGVVPLRGYQDQSIGPRNGGKVMSRYQAELRFAVSLEPMPVYVYIFGEAGNVWQDFKSTDPFNLKRAAGLGVQMMINPIGMIGFSYGYGFDKDVPTNQVSGWRFLFHLGQQ